MEIAGVYRTSLNYSACNEDSYSEIEALIISQEDELLCITGSGGPPLNLLTKSPKKIVSVDFNMTQNWLLELKIAAIKNLQYEELIEFIGVKEGENRLEYYKKIKEGLSEESQKYWNNNTRVISKGVLYQGKLEKYFKYSSDILKMTIGDKIDKMFCFEDIKKQYDFYKNDLEKDPAWKEYIKSASSNYYSKRTIEPMYEYLGDEFNYEELAMKQYDKIFKTHLLTDNHLTCLSVDGSYNRLKKMPIWLQRENFELIQTNIHKIDIVNKDIISYLKESEKNKFDKFALSNVIDYLDEEQCNMLFKLITNCAKENARICIRYSDARDIPSAYSEIVKRDLELEERLEKKDLVLEYKFIIGDLVKLR